MEYILVIVISYGAFTTGTIFEACRAHKIWQKETLPVIRENERLKSLMRLHGIDHLLNQQPAGQE